MSIELLQKLGLNKYEAEAYYTLLAQGPLTGYELGKRSQVPLSRSYEILERLSQRGLALIQPGDPARFQALEPTLFLDQVRSTMEKTLGTLTEALTRVTQPSVSSEFWVIRTRQHILERVKTLCIQTTQTLQLALSPSFLGDLESTLAEKRQHNCLVQSVPVSSGVLLLSDSHEALLGTLEPGESCQAVVSANPALVAAVSSYFLLLTAHFPSFVQGDPEVVSPSEHNWLEWESRKQQRLRKGDPDQRIA